MRGDHIASLQEQLREARQANALLLEKVETLALRADLYHQAVDNSPNPIFSIDAEGIIQTWNPACQSVYLYDDRIVGRHYGVLLEKPAQRDFIARQLAEITSQHKLTNVDLSYRCRNNTVREMVSRIYPVHDKNGRVAGYVFANTDVTDRNMVLRELEEYKSTLESLVEKRTAKLSREIRSRRQAQNDLKSANDVLIRILDSIEVEISVTGLVTGEVIFVNRHLQEAVERGIYGKDGSAGFLHRDHDGEGDGVRPPDEHRQATGGRSSVYFNDRLDRWYLVHDQVIQWVDGRSVRLQVATDITERQRIEAEQQRAAKLESIGMLAGGLAHDFNNLLTGIMGNTSLLRAVNQDLQHSRLLANIESATSRATELTRQLLTFSKGGAPIKKPTSIAELLDESVDFAIRGSAVTCELNVDPELRAADVDPGQITQVIHNIVFNAVQAMPQGGTLRVTASNVDMSGGTDSRLAPGRYLKVVFRDEGAGISPENLARVFDPYFTTKDTGSGLGLATAHTIMRRHGGFISARSDHGAVFTLYLPASDGRVAQVEEDLHAAATFDRHILVMDDEEMVREVAVAMLGLVGCQAVATPHGESAIESYRQAWTAGRPFDAVILDLTVRGGMGGQETLEQLRKLDPEVRAIVSSGYSNNPVMADFQKFGFIDVVSKPYRLEEIREVLRRVFSR